MRVVGINGNGTTYANPGEYNNPEAMSFFIPRKRLDSRSSQCVIACHGILGTAGSWIDPENLADDWQAICRYADRAGMGGDLGGLTSWGNPTSVFAVRRNIQAVTQGLPPWNEFQDTVDPSRVVLYGQSMGAAVACNAAIRLPELVSGLMLLVPAVDLVGLRDDNVFGFASSINSAYGGASAFDAAAPTYSPWEYIDQLIEVFGNRIAVWYSLEDEIIPPSYIEPFAEAVADAGGHVEIISGSHGAALTNFEFPGKLAGQIAAGPAAQAVKPNRKGIVEEHRWYQLIRNAGALVGTFRYLGGDVTDMIQVNPTTRVWIGADWFAGTSITALDNFAGNALPFRNGLIRDVNGAFAGQEFNAGTSGSWIEVNTGLYPAATHYWPICGIMEGSVMQVGCWLVGTGGAYGDLQDSHIVSINTSTWDITGAPVPFNNSDGRFWIDGMLTPGDGFTYVYFQEFVPPYESGYGLGDLNNSKTYKRVGRVPAGELTNIAGYRWWNGKAWVAGMTNATRLIDSDQHDINGDSGVAKTPLGDYMMVAHQLIDNYFKVYKSHQPQGPWSMTHIVPARDMGAPWSGGVRIGQLTKILPDFPSSPGTMMTLTSMNNLNTVEPFSARHISTYSPRFQEIPYT